MKSCRDSLIKVGLLSLFFFPSIVSAATYYVDATLGSNSNNGTATSTPWQTLAKVNVMTFAAGDNIFLKRGETFSGNIVVGQSGTSGNPITYGAYGEGARPIINATGTNHGVDIRTNKSYIDLHSLDVRNATQNGVLLLSNVSHVNIVDVSAVGGNTGGYNIQTGNFSDITISSSTASAYTGAGIRLTGTASGNVLISNVIATSSTGTNGFLGGGDMVDLTIEDSVFGNHTNAGINIPTGTTTNILIRNVTSTDNALAGIQFGGGLKSGIVIDDVTVLRNRRGINFTGTANFVASDINIINTHAMDNLVQGINFEYSASGAHVNDIFISTTTASDNGDDSTAEQHGVRFSGAFSDVRLSNITAEDNNDSGITFFANGGTGISEMVYVSDSVAQRNGGNGIDFTASTTASGARVTDVTASHNLNDGFNIHGIWQDVVFDRTIATENGVDGSGSDGDGYSYHETSTGVVRNSIARNNKKSAITNINAASTTIYNNLFSNDTQGTNALARFMDSGSNALYNNVFYNPSQMGIGLSSEGTTTVTAMNNLFQGFNIGIQRLPDGSLIEDHNLVYGAATNNFSGLTQGAHSLSSDPKFADAGDGDFRLLGSSPAINAGTSTPYDTDILGNAPYGPARDLGAYEYQADPEPTPEPEEETTSRSRSGQSSVRVVSPLADSVQKAGNTVQDLILANRALFLAAKAQGIVLPAFVLETLGIAPSGSFTRDLTIGSLGADVTALQQILKAKGFYTYPEITGYYGQITLQAVADFQKSLGLESVGYVGPATRAALNVRN